MSLDYLSELNKKQKEAVEHIDGPLMIVAGAGTGKTKTLTHRVIHLILKGTAPREILAITFTNKAAKEMKDRVSNLTSKISSVNAEGYYNQPFVSTFHSLGVHILRHHGKHNNIAQTFTILDKNDSLAVIKESMREIGLDPKQEEPKKVQNIISKQKNNMISFDEYTEISGASYFAKNLLGVWKRYEEILKKRKALDFDDLLLQTVLLLKHSKVAREYYQDVWKYIHVDEYQDTNKVQYEITKILAQHHGNICVVGDTDQNIYGWRGADIKNMLNFEKDYPNSQVILLEQNYRSTQTILKVANDIIKKNKERVEKDLFTKNTEGENIHIYDAFNEQDEAQFVSQEAERLIGEDKVKPSDIAVLYRANFQSRVLEEAFLKNNVSYQVLGTKFFDRKEVKDVLSYLKASLNTESLYDIKRCINVPTRGIGKVTLMKIFADKKNELNPKMLERVQIFYNLLANIKEFGYKNKVSETIKFIIKNSGLEKHLKDGGDDGQERLENLKELVTLSVKYDSLEPEDGLNKLLEDSALATDQDSLEKPQEAVKLMTVHAAKGLEFKHVFITGMEQDLFPHARLGETKQTEADEEEERRLFYVALTRAKERVYLTYASMRTIFGSQQMNIPSEFILDIDDVFITPVRGEGFDYPDKKDDGKVVYLDF